MDYFLLLLCYSILGVIMRKIFAILMLVCALTFSACSSKKPKSSKVFVSTKCDMVCSNTECNQICTSVEGTLK